MAVKKIVMSICVTIAIIGVNFEDNDIVHALNHTGSVRAIRILGRGYVTLIRRYAQHTRQSTITAASASLARQTLLRKNREGGSGLRDYASAALVQTAK